MQCGAKTRSGGSCAKSALANKARCRLHGGLSLSGKDHPQYIHGKRSKEYIARGRKARERLRELINLGRSIGVFID